MASMLGGIAIYPEKSGFMRKRPAREAFDAVHHVLYSNDNVIDACGHGPVVYRNRIFVATASAASLEALRQQTAALVLHDTSYGTVYVRSLTECETEDNSATLTGYDAELLW